MRPCCPVFAQEAKQSFDLGFREHYPSFQVSMNRIIAHGEMPQMAAIPKVWLAPEVSVLGCLVLPLSG